MGVAELNVDGGVSLRKQRSLWADAFRRLVQNRAALFGGIFIIILVFVAIFADKIAPYGYAKQDLLSNNVVAKWMMPLMPPGSERYVHTTTKYILGADYLGRDILSRTIYGSRVSLSIAFVAATVSLVIGTLYGIVSGYLGGVVDDLMMRLVDFLYGFPFLVVVILLQTYFKAMARRGGQGGFGTWMIHINQAMGGMFFLFIAIGLINWIGMARIARGQVLSYREKEFIEAARALGAGHSRIILKHLLPNIVGPLIVAETMAIPGYIFTEAFLSFIGLGVDPPTPSWGIMISEAVPALRSYPVQILVPSVALTLTTLAFNFLGDGLRDALDPRLQQ